MSLWFNRRRFTPIWAIVLSFLAPLPLSAQEKTPEQKLFRGIRLQHIDKVVAQIRAGADLNGVDAKGRHPLTESFKNLKPRIFLKLYESGSRMPPSAADAPAKARQAWWDRAGEWAHLSDKVQGRRFAVQVLLDAGVPPPRYPNLEYLRSLHERGRIGMIRNLAMSEDKVYGAALCYAVRYSDQALFEDLMARGWSVHHCHRTPGKKANSPLLEAARQNLVETAQALIAAGANPRRKHLLSTAASYGHLEIAQALIDAGAPVDGHPRSRPLLRASTYEMKELLLKAGANPNLSPKGKGFPPLAGAVIHKNIESVELYLKYGADPRALWGDATMLDLAQESTDPKIVELITTALNQAAETPVASTVESDLDIAASIEDTGLHEIYGFLKPCRADILAPHLQTGADPSAMTEAGPAVHVAAVDCLNLPMVDLLTDAGARIDQTDEQGRTALEKLLIDEIHSRRGRISRKYRRKADIPKVVAGLLERGADPDGAPGRRKVTPLMVAIEQAQKDIVERLIAAGANPNAKDDKGRDLDWYRWKARTRKNQRHEVRRLFTQLTLEIPDHYKDITGSVRNHIRKDLPSGQKMAANFMISAHINQAVHPIQILFQVDPRVEKVTAPELRRLHPEAEWQERIELSENRVAIGDTQFSTARSFRGEYETAALTGVVKWSPYPLMVNVFGPKDQLEELRWLRKGALNAIEAGPALTLQEQVQMVSKVFKPSFRDFRDKVIEAGQVLLGLGLLIALFILLSLRDSQIEGRPSDPIAVLAQICLISLIFCAAWVLSYLGVYRFLDFYYETSSEYLRVHDQWIFRGRKADTEISWTDPKVLGVALLVFLPVALIWARYDRADRARRSEDIL